MQQRTCPTCGQSFKPTTPNQRYCPPTEADRSGPGQARSRCANRGRNHAQRTREGRDTKPLDAPIVEAFDCAQCDKHCVPGENVAAHASKFCGVECKAGWHWRSNTHTTAATRLLSMPPSLTSADMANYKRALRRDPCSYCGQPGEASDHITPKSNRGPDDWTNRASACHQCNGTKGQTPLLVFLAWKRARDEFEPWRQIVAAIHTRAA